MSVADRRARFHELHAREGIFVMPNPWDVGSARLLARAGSRRWRRRARATPGCSARSDHAVTRDELVAHVADLAAAVDVPLSVDSERCFASDPAGVAETVRLLADAGAAGCSIEDWDQENGRIDDPGHADRARRGRGRGGPRARRPARPDGPRREPPARHRRPRRHDRAARRLPGRRGRLRLRAGPDRSRADRRGGRRGRGAGERARAARRAVGARELEELGVRRVSTGSLLARTAYGAMLAGRPGAAGARHVGLRAGRDLARGSGGGVRRVSRRPGAILYPSRE